MIKVLQILAVNLLLVFDTSGVSLIQSGKDTNLIGAGVTAKTINLHSGGNLYIESLQDREYQKQSSQSAGLQLELGLGSAWSFSLSGSSAKGTARRNQVNEQSGLYAEEGGYHIHADNVHLKGGVIASTNAENSELTTNRFTFEDIQNDSHSQATSLSGSVGMSRSSDTLYDQNGKVINNPTRAQYADKSLKREKGETGLTGGVGIPLHESQSDSSLTKATLTEGKITLNKDNQPTQTTAKALGINTELDKANEQVEAPKDIAKVLKEQQIYTQSIGNMLGAVNTFASQKAEEAKAEAEKAKAELEQAQASGDVAKIKEKETAYTEAKANQESWENGGSTKRKLDTAVTVLGTLLAGKPIADTAVAAISPELNAQIHEQTKDSEGANLFAHAVLSAVEFYATGKDPLAGAVAGVAGEGTAMLAGKVLGKSPSQLTEEERDMLKTAAQLAGAIAGGAAGDSMASTIAGLETAKRAVENNYLYRQEAEELLNLRLALQLTTNAEEKEKIQTRINELEKLDQDRQEHIKTVCPDFGKSSSACSAAIADAEKAKASYNGWTDQYQPVSYNSKDKRPYKAIFTRDYDRVNEALTGKDDFTIYKEELAKEMAANGNVPLKDAYHIVDTAFALNDALNAVNAVYAGKTTAENLTKLTKIVQKGLNAPVVKNGGKAEIDALQRIGKNSKNYNKEINMEISNRRNSHIYNLEAVNNLKNGILPGNALNNKTKPPEEGKIGVPRNMPASTNPDLMALDFAEKFLGRKILSIEWENGNNIFKKNGVGKDCVGCFFVDLGNKQSVLYRPGISSNSSAKTLDGTATLEIKTNSTLEINGGKALKLKFPKE